MPFSYANPTSGPSAGGIGWFDFGSLTMQPGQTVTGLTGTLHDGTTVTFDLTATNLSGAARTFDATTIPTYVGSQFGTTGYTGIAGNVAMQTQFSFSPGSNDLTMTNIVVKDALGNPVPNYTVVVADAESTGLAESWVFKTNAGPWEKLAQLGNQPSPVLTGLGTQTATLTGIDSAILEAAYVVTSQNPTQLSLTTTTTNNAGGREAVAIGFALTRVRLQKYVAGRISGTDQFVLDLAGAPASSATTAGASSGMQSSVASVFAIPGNTYTLNETMAAGSANVLTDYTQIVSASNATPAGSVPPMGSLPIAFTPALGDDVTYTIYNAIPSTFTKTVDKAYANVGELLTYTVVIDNPNDFPVNNVLLTDADPVGTTFAGNLLVSAPYTGTDPATGLVISTIAPKGVVTVSWQVQVNTVPPIATPVVNIAQITVPGGNSGVTNLVSTDIRTAHVTIGKAVDIFFAQPGDVLTYTLTLGNAGNVAAYDVVITDAVPTGATFIPGSLTGATGSLPTLTLLAPLAAGGTATVTYQVKIGNSVPVPNPIPNSAVANYKYTVNPAQPKGVSGTAHTGVVETLVSIARLKISKSVNKTISYVGDTLTYQIALTNTGNTAANNVVLTDNLTTGTSYIPGSLSVSAPYTGTPATTIALTGPVAAGQTVALTFQVKVDTAPNPNPIINTVGASYTYTVDPLHPDAVHGAAQSNLVRIVVLRNNYGQQVTDLIESVAQEQAALAAIINAEGAKIQRMAAMGGVTPAELLCLNESVADMMDSIGLLETVLKQKLGTVDCQISGDVCN